MKIKWRGKLTIEKLPQNPVPDSATELKSSKNTSALIIVAVVIIVFAIILMNVKRVTIGISVNLIACIIGLLLSLFFMPVHELLHAICLPKNVNALIFFTKHGLSLYFDKALRRSRYIFLLLFPLSIAGLLPFFTWIFIPLEYVVTNSVIFAFSLSSLGLSIGDLIQVNNVLKQVPKNSLISISGMLIYYYPEP